MCFELCEGFQTNFFYMGVQNVHRLESRIFDSHLRIKVMALWSFPICLYLEAKRLQCTLRECALFRKRVLLDHVLAEYGLDYSVWHGMSEG